VVQVRMDGSDGRTDLRLAHPDSLAIYHRDTTKMDGSVLYIGTMTQPPTSTRASPGRFETQKVAESCRIDRRPHHGFFSTTAAHVKICNDYQKEHTVCGPRNKSCRTKPGVTKAACNTKGGCASQVLRWTWTLSS